MKQRKVAIVSDLMMTWGGAEVVVMELMKIFPEANFYTLFISPEARKKIEEKFPKVKVRTSIFQCLIKGDKVSKYISIIKLFSWIYWEFLDLKQYNLIISSSHSYMAKNVKKGREARHLAYVHTPPRYLYEEFNEIGWIRKKPWSWCFWPLKKILRYIDKKGSMRADVMIANSKNVASRIKKYYQRKAEIVYPPVKVEIPKNTIRKGRYYVCLSRLVRQKGVDLAIRTCTDNKIPLVVIGSGGELKNLKKMAGLSVKFVENCEDDQKFKILAGAKALIYTSREEDFGIVPVESLKMGVPVIAYDSGGVRETVIQGKNGVFFNKFDENNLWRAMKLLESLNISAKACIESTSKFSSEHFQKQINNLILK